ncbi:uncharacterized protein LOC122277084 [Carya illinoinensis]|uniref:uncharacterized protein LOC122277084 n=1 Tax=Carya illinoinensis TaxID=32201 RepID=UPI001C7195D6|nr:uncharacterized protein LOC122277084 [Carya illinoinensis]
MAGMIARLIWNRRNESVHGKDPRHPNSILVKAKEDLRLYHLVQSKERSNGAVVCPNLVQKWKKPPAGKLKLNWDAAINASVGVIGMGGLVRDCQGRVLGSVRANRKLKLSPLDAEAYALLVASQFCKDSGLSELVLEGDSMQVVLKMKNSVRDWSQASLILEEAKSILNSFTSWKIEHTKRDANMAAHLLAKDALNVVDDIFDLESIPDCIKSAVLSDSM